MSYVPTFPAPIPPHPGGLGPDDGIATAADDAERLGDDGNLATVEKAQLSDKPGTAALNDFKGRDPDLLAIGEKIKLESGEVYEVEAGDTLYTIAGGDKKVEQTLMKINGFDQGLYGQRSDGLYYDHNAAEQLSAQLVAPSGSENKPKIEPAATDTSTDTSTTTVPGDEDKNTKRKGERDDREQ